MTKEPYITERRKQIQLAVEKFISLIRDVKGVIEVALFGSASSEKAVPQDFDLMVFIENTDCISHVSKRRRHLLESLSLSGSILRKMKVSASNGLTRVTSIRTLYPLVHTCVPDKQIRVYLRFV